MLLTRDLRNSGVAAGAPKLNGHTVPARRNSDPAPAKINGHGHSAKGLVNGQVNGVARNGQTKVRAAFSAFLSSIRSHVTAQVP